MTKLSLKRAGGGLLLAGAIGLAVSSGWAQAPQADSPAKNGAAKTPAKTEEHAAVTGDSPHGPCDAADLLKAERYRTVGAASENAVERALNKVISVEFKTTPLIDVAKTLGEKIGVNVVIDQKSLDAAGVAPDTKVTRSLKEISARSVLHLILRQLDLTYVAANEVLLITSAEQVSNKIVTQIYPVHDLLYGPESFVDGSGDALIDLIASTILPASWDVVGGQGSLKGLETVDAIVISNTPEIHSEITELLADVRKARDQQGLKPDVCARRGVTSDGKPKRAFREATVGDAKTPATQPMSAAPAAKPPAMGEPGK